MQNEKEGYMNRLLKAVGVGVLSCLVGLMCACASSSLVDKWYDPGFQAPPLVKMLVIAVGKNATKRRIWEDAFAKGLAEYGVTATPSYSLFADAPPDTDQVAATVQANGFDALIVILKLPTETNAQFIQGYTSTEQDLRYSFYWQRYWTVYREIDHPGYIDTQTVAIRSIDVTTTGNHGRLIWSATSRTPDPRSVEDVQTGVADLVMSELAQYKFIGPRK
jgi:hypothetical protein